MSPIVVTRFEGLFIDRRGKERACVVAGSSLDDLTVDGAGITIGEAVLAFYVEALGLMHGHVEEGPDATFHLRIKKGTARRARLAARLAWHPDRLLGGVDHRTSPRVVPHRTAVLVRLGRHASRGGITGRVDRGRGARRRAPPRDRHAGGRRHATRSRGPSYGKRRCCPLRAAASARSCGRGRHVLRWPSA